MLKIAALVLASIPVMLAAMLLSSTCVVVDIKQADGPRIIVPVPLFVARTALAFAPQEAKHVPIPELAEYRDLAEEILTELREAPDGVLVEVHDDGEHVLIEKVGDDLEINVHGDDEEVSVTVPLTFVLDILDGYDGEELNTSDVLAALSSVSRTDLVHVKTKDEEVRVWIW
jgi:hypothetical protein